MTVQYNAYVRTRNILTLIMPFSTLTSGIISGTLLYKYCGRLYKVVFSHFKGCGSEAKRPGIKFVSKETPRSGYAIETHQTPTVIPTDTCEPKVKDTETFIKPDKDNQNTAMCTMENDPNAETDKNLIQKLQIVSKLFPMIPEQFAKFILKTCGGEISKTIDFILSKNLNDPCKTMPFLPHAVFNGSLYGGQATTAVFGGTPFCRFPAYSPMSSAVDGLRLPWNMYGRFPACSLPIRFNTEGKCIASLPDSSFEETNGAELQAIDDAN